MKSIYILFIGLLFGFSMQAQDTLTLYQQWQKQPHDPIKLKLALQLAEPGFSRPSIWIQADMAMSC